MDRFGHLELLEFPEGYHSVLSLSLGAVPGILKGLEVR
jgi:hypothetical protein